MPRGANGVPLKSEYEAVCPEPNSIFVMFAKYFFVFSMLGALTGVVIWRHRPERAAEKVGVLVHYELGPLYIALFVLKFAFQMIWANVATTRRACRINNPDQHFFRVFGGVADHAIVLMDVDGVYGNFNRAQRGVATFQEHLPLFLMETAAAGFVFPLLTGLVVVGFAVARFLGARGYTQSARGRQANLGSYLAMGFLDGLTLFIGVLATRAARCS